VLALLAYPVPPSSGPPQAGFPGASGPRCWRRGDRSPTTPPTRLLFKVGPPGGGWVCGSGVFLPPFESLPRSESGDPGSRIPGPQPKHHPPSLRRHPRADTSHSSAQSSGVSLGYEANQSIFSPVSSKRTIEIQKFGVFNLRQVFLCWASQQNF